MSENSLGVYDDYKRKKCRQIFDYVNPDPTSMMTKDTVMKIDPTWPEGTKIVLSQI
jgi:hypothetical protein